MSSLTKIFIVLQLVCSLVLAVMVVSLVAHQEPYKQQVEAQTNKANAATALLAARTNENEKLNQDVVRMTAERQASSSKAADEISRLQNTIATIKIDKDALDAKNAQAVASVAQLTSAVESANKQIAVKDTDNSRLTTENVRLVQQNAEDGRKINENETALKFAEQSIRKLQEQINAQAENSGKGGAQGTASEANTVAQLTVQTPAQINGKITQVTPTPGRILVELPLGSRDGVRKNTVFYVYRDQNYIADAVVQNVEPDQSVAAVDPSKIKKGETVKVGDLVISGSAK